MINSSSPDSEDQNLLAEQVDQLNLKELPEPLLEGPDAFEKMFRAAQATIETLKAENQTILDTRAEIAMKLEVLRTEYEKLYLKYESTCLRHYDEKRQIDKEFQTIKRTLMKEVEFLEKCTTDLEEENEKAKEEVRRLGGMLNEMVPKICVGKTEEEWLVAAKDLLEKNIELKIQVENVEKANEEVKLENQKVKDEGEKLKKFLREKYGSEFRSLNQRNMELTRQCEALTEKTSRSVEEMKKLFENSQKKLEALEKLQVDAGTAESHSQWSKTMRGLVAKCHMVFSVPYCKLCGAEYSEQKVAKMLGEPLG